MGIEPDAKKGYELIRTKPMGRQVMSVADVDRLWLVWEDDEKAIAEAASPDERRGMTFERYGWAKRPEDEKLGFRWATPRTHKACWPTIVFPVMVVTLPVQPIPGMGNTHVDLTTLGTDLNKLKTLDAGGDPDKVGFPIPFPTTTTKVLPTR